MTNQINKNMNKVFQIMLLGFSLIFVACEDEFVDPSNPTSSQVLGSAEGLNGLAVGMQYRWSVGRQSSVYNIVAGPGFTTGELRLINPGNVDENEVDLGGEQVTGANNIVSNMWEQAMLTKSEAQIILDEVETVVSNAGIKAGLVATASLFKEMALGTLIQYFEQVPLRVDKDAKFSSREEVLNEVIQTLETGKSSVSSISAEFLKTTTGTIDLGNSINALLARYYLMKGDYDKAISAASAVDLSSKSTYSYDDVNPNPIAFVSIRTNNVFQPINLTLGLGDVLKPDEADKRLPFYFANTAPANQDFRGGGFFDENGDGIPVYLPGEMTLIKAEAYARKSDLTKAVAELDKIITKNPASDPFGIGAGFSSGYSGNQVQSDILDEIYRQRCIELYMSGLKFEDSRRFGRPGPGSANPERNRNWYPYPNSERVNNSNTPSDPAN